MNSIRAVLLLLVLIVISIATRVYQLDGRVDYFSPCQIITLTALEIWQEKGLSESHYSPIQTYSNEGDKFNTPYVRVEDKEGNNFYVSYPPFAFLFAHAFFTSTGIYPSHLPLQALNIFLHLLSALLLYLVICFHSHKAWQSLFLPAIVGFAAYLFLPVVLYAHTQVFFPDMMGNLLWIAGIYAALKVFHQQDKKHFSLLGILIFLGVYSEWICALFAFAVGLSAWVFHREFLSWKKILIVAVIASGFSLALCVIQYSSISGLEDFLKALKGRFGERSGFLGEYYSGKDANMYSATAWLAVARNFHSSFYAIGYFTLATFAAVLVLQKLSLRKLSKQTKLLLALTFIPALLHFFLLFNFNTIHYHAYAKFGIPLCIALGLVTRNLISSLHSFSIAVFLVVFVSALSFSAVYFRTSNPHEMNHPYLTEAAAIIQNEAGKDETVFVKIESDVTIPFFYVSYRAKRNLMPVNSAADAEVKLRKQGKDKGVFFYINERNASYAAEHFILE